MSCVAVQSSVTPFQQRNDSQSKLYYFPHNTKMTSSSAETPYEDSLYSNEKAAVARNWEELMDALNAVSVWPQNWDSHGSDAPQWKSVKNAKIWLLKIFELVCFYNLCWCLPAISADEYGNIVCEWWKDNKKLTLDFYESEVEYTKISNIDSNPEFEIEIFSNLPVSGQYTLAKWIFV